MILLTLLLINPFSEGGPIMMSLITICLIISIVFLIRGFSSLKSNVNLSKKIG
ncbi:hypothetical protein [Bizionia sp. M204]|uniref:hypothetical protein n=1 Tax=Bizionia sp. M204 TaxID=2675331 RepID=UPI0020BFB5B0|nr:hypothetical protein [Bizionia sp. M204]